jgi:REP element-mobilizing transposase RayT
MLEYRRRLPHFQPDGVYLFLTWRLWGSLPKMRETASYPTPGHAFIASDRALDQAEQGPYWLGDPRIAQIVTDAILRGDEARSFYKLRAWVIMPNHVHLLLLPSVPLPTITRWLKGSTANRANKLLGRIGESFWQDESFDHWIRNNRQFERTIWYIEHNPVAAGLIASSELWPWSSASGQGTTTAIASSAS